MSNNFVITVITAWFNISAYSWYWQWPYIWEIVYVTQQALQWNPQVKNQGEGHAKRVFQWRWRRKGASGTNWKIYYTTEWGGGVLSVAYSPLWSKRQGSKQYMYDKSITMNLYLNVGGFFFHRFSPFFGGEEILKSWL